MSVLAHVPPVVSCGLCGLLLVMPAFSFGFLTPVYCWFYSGAVWALSVTRLRPDLESVEYSYMMIAHSDGIKALLAITSCVPKPGTCRISL